jgi:hypothetical protein
MRMVSQVYYLRLTELSILFWVKGWPTQVGIWSDKMRFKIMSKGTESTRFLTMRLYVYPNYQNQIFSSVVYVPFDIGNQKN